MTTTLKGLRINRIDFVDRGANPGARVCLFKRDTQEEVVSNETPTVEELQAQLEAEVTKRQEAEAKLQETGEVSKRVTELEQKLAKSQDEVKDLREADEMRHAIVKAEKIEEIFGPAADFAPMLRKIYRTLDETERKAWDEKVTGAVELVKEAAHFKEIGSGGTDGAGDAYSKLEKAARTKYPDKSTADAVSAFLRTAEGKELHKQYRKEQEGN